MQPDTPVGTGQEAADVRSVDGVLLQLGIHGQENKWWMLYIFLMFNSILLLSCAALFAAAHCGTLHKVPLSVFAAGGILIDICWLPMAAGSAKASDLYSNEIVDAERRLPQQWPKPRTKRAGQRACKSPSGLASSPCELFPSCSS